MAGRVWKLEIFDILSEMVPWILVRDAWLVNEGLEWDWLEAGPAKETAASYIRSKTHAAVIRRVVNEAM